MSKRQDLIIEPRDFPVFLKARMLQAKVDEFAASLGVTPKLVYMLLNGSKKPSAAMLKKLGLEVVYRVADPGSKK